MIYFSFPIFLSAWGDSKGIYLDDPDVQLMLKFQKGDKASFEILMRKYYPRILNFVYRYSRSREIAEDLTQEVFLKVFKTASRYQPQSKFRTWLYTIAKNTSLNELRARKRITVSLDENLKSGEDEFQRQIEDTTEINPDEQALHNEMAATVKEAISALPENQRLAVILRRYENLSYEEIAKTMNVTPKAVKSLLNRAKENLKQKLAKFARLD